jgi:hypothetical protein
VSLFVFPACAATSEDRSVALCVIKKIKKIKILHRVTQRKHRDTQRNNEKYINHEDKIKNFYSCYFFDINIIN